MKFADRPLDFLIPQCNAVAMQTLIEGSTGAAAAGAESRSGAQRVMAVLVPGSAPVDVVSQAAELVDADGEVIVTVIAVRPPRYVLAPMGLMTEVGMVLWCHADDEAEVMLSRAGAELASRRVAYRFEQVELRDSAFTSRRRRFAAEALADTCRRLGADIVVVGSGGDGIAATLRCLIDTRVIEVPASMGEPPPPV